MKHTLSYFLAALVGLSSYGIEITREFNSFAPEGIVKANEQFFATSYKSGVISTSSSNSIFTIAHYLSDWTQDNTLLGISYDEVANRFIFVSRDYLGGSVISLDAREVNYFMKHRKKKNMFAARVHVTNAGQLNDVEINNGNIYITNSDPTEGKLLKFGLRELYRLSNHQITKENIVASELNFANGLIVNDGHALICLTGDQEVVKINLETGERELFADINEGWPDDILRISANIYLVSDNEEGNIFLINKEGKVLNKVPLAHSYGAKVKPANIAFERKTGKVMMTNLWDSNLGEVLYSEITGHDINEYNLGVYSVKLKDLMKFNRLNPKK